MNFSSLNHDILAAIASLLRTTDALALAATSKYTDPIAKTDALRSVVLYGHRKLIVQKFLAFMLADIPNRLHKLQYLSFQPYASVTDVNRQIYPDLFELIQKAMYLKYFNISGITYVYGSQLPDILDALALLPSLVRLELSWLPLDVFVKVPGTVRQLILHYGTPADSHDMQLFPQIKSHTPTIAPAQQLLQHQRGRHVRVHFRAFDVANSAGVEATPLLCANIRLCSCFPQCSRSACR